MKRLQKKNKKDSTIYRNLRITPLVRFSNEHFYTLKPWPDLGRGVKVKGNGCLGPIPSRPCALLGNGREHRLKDLATDMGIGALVSLS